MPGIQALGWLRRSGQCLNGIDGRTLRWTPPPVANLGRVTVKKNTIAIALVLLVFSLPAHSKPTCKKQTIEDLAKAVGEAFEAKDLGRLDANNASLRKLRMVIRHSLGEGDNEYEIKRVRSFREGERWLRSRETEEYPGRSVRHLVRCRRGICSYDFDSGIVHLVLYIQRITYGYSNGCPYIKTIYLLDGD